MVERILDPWSSEIPADYEQVMADFGISKVTDEMVKQMPDNKLFRRKIVFAHRDLDKIIQAYKQKKEFAVMTGIKPTNKLHLGNKLVVDQLVHYQNMGGKIYYSVADIEAYHANQQDLEKSAEIAIDNIADLLALGVKKDNFFYKQSTEEDVMRLGYLYARNVTSNMLRAIYGEHSIGHYMSALIQVGDILYPEMQKFGGTKPVIVPIGIDQDPHMRLTRDVANKHRLVAPSSTYTKFTRSLSGAAKMSKSEPSGMITLSEKPETARKKVVNSFTGGRDTIEEQKKLGGEPLKCCVYELYVQHFEPDDKKLNERFDDCKAGKLVCGECKQELSNRLVAFLEEHQKKKQKMVAIAEQLLKH